MQTFKIKDIVIGEGLPKVCVPLMAKDIAELGDLAGKAESLPCDLIEWRCDALSMGAYRDTQAITEGLAEIRKRTSKPVILTLRTATEGGLADIAGKQYYALIRDYSSECLPDMIDIQAFGSDDQDNTDIIDFVVTLAKEQGIGIILSHHDFNDTPSIEQIVGRIKIMDKMGADIPKAAYMPGSEEDVLAVLEAQKRAAESCDKPFVILSMGSEGQPSRITGGNAGCCITYASADEESAPGQIDVHQIKDNLRQFYGYNG